MENLKTKSVAMIDDEPVSLPIATIYAFDKSILS